MKTTLIVVVGILLFGVGATYHRYESFSPCNWMEQDLARQSKLPMLVIKAQVKAKFLLQGIVEPNPNQCIKMWWQLKADGELKALPKPDKKNQHK